MQPVQAFVIETPDKLHLIYLKILLCLLCQRYLVSFPAWTSDGMKRSFILVD
jgi:hypothetical protein